MSYLGILYFYMEEEIVTLWYVWILKCQIMNRMGILDFEKSKVELFSNLICVSQENFKMVYSMILPRDSCSLKLHWYKRICIFNSSPGDFDKDPSLS